MVVVTTALISFRCLLLVHHNQLITQQREHEVQQTVFVEPDAVKKNGNLVTTVGKTERGEKCLCSIRVTSYEQVKWLANLHQPFSLTVRGIIQPISPGTNENQFDSRRFYQSQGVSNVIHGTLVHKQVLKPTITDWLHCWRAQLENYFMKFPAPLSLFCQRLLLGIDDIELNETVQQVRRLGIIHLFCLSGLHVSVLSGFLRRGLSSFNVPREHVDLIQVFALLVFWVIGGQSASLTRAVMMMEVGLIGKFCYLPKLDTWSISLLVHVMLVPGILMNLGGQLSYLLSFALCRINWTSVWKQTKALNYMSVPLLLNATYQVHGLTMLLNYVMIPLFSWIILPAVVTCAVVGWKLPFFLLLCNRGLELYQRLLSWLASLPGLVTYGKLPDFLTMFMVVITILYCERRKGTHIFRNILIISYVLIFVWIHFPLKGEVTFFDIGQGDSILIREPFNRRVVLIDTGGRLNFKVPQWQKRVGVRDEAQRTSINYLKSRGINKIDAIMLSHSDADHIGYLTTFCREMNVKTVMVPAGMEKMVKFTKRLPVAMQVIPVTNRTKLRSIPLQVLHPFHSGQGTNEDSMVLLGHFGGKKFIFTGDLDRTGELKIMQKNPKLRADVIKLGHHGSKTASDPQFLKQLQPELAIISAGRHNRYGHPNVETMYTLQEQRIISWSTQQYGMIKYTYDQHSGKFSTKLKGDEYSWMR